MNKNFSDKLRKCFGLSKSDYNLKYKNLISKADAKDKLILEVIDSFDLSYDERSKMMDKRSQLIPLVELIDGKYYKYMLSTGVYDQISGDSEASEFAGYQVYFGEIDSFLDVYYSDTLKFSVAESLFNKVNSSNYKSLLKL